MKKKKCNCFINLCWEFLPDVKWKDDLKAFAVAKGNKLISL